MLRFNWSVIAIASGMSFVIWAILFRVFFAEAGSKLVGTSQGMWIGPHFLYFDNAATTTAAIVSELQSVLLTRQKRILALVLTGAIVAVLAALISMYSAEKLPPFTIPVIPSTY